MVRDMKLVECEECSHRFVSSGVYLEHMAEEHPDSKPVEIIYVAGFRKPARKKRTRYI